MKLISKQNADYSFTPLCLARRVNADTIHRLFNGKVERIESQSVLTSIHTSSGKQVYIVVQDIDEIGKGGNYLVQEKDTLRPIGVCTKNYHQELMDYCNNLGHNDVPCEYQILQLKVL